jgi:hypothetical protein
MVAMFSEYASAQFHVEQVEVEYESPVEAFVGGKESTVVSAQTTPDLKAPSCDRFADGDCGHHRGLHQRDVLGGALVAHGTRGICRVGWAQRGSEVIYRELL